MSADLVVRLDFPLPSSVPVGRGTALFFLGACFHRRERVREVELVVDGRRHSPAASRMPRPDLLDVMPYRSGFWATIPIEARDRPGRIELGLAARLESGAEVAVSLGRVDVVERGSRPADGKRSGLIAVCMATYDPDIALLRAQIDSLRAQTDADWICVISDDCSRPERFEAINDAIAGDPRFVVSRSPRQLGPYRNFERLLEMVPPEAELVALCDQDDRWHPDKLEALRGALGPARLVYSDQRLVDAEGGVLRETLWRGRRNNHTNLASLLVANSVTGAATLMRREVAELALPFPDTPGWQFHDHWLGLLALASGDVAYVDRPLYDYVQHSGAVVGQAAGPTPRPSWRPRAALRRWRAAYFYGYLPRVVLAQALLARCGEVISPRKRRTLEAFVAADRRPLALAWLAARAARVLTGANETLGTELELARGILWRHAIRARTGRREEPGRRRYDASCPPLDAAALGQDRLRRWRAGA
jgi:glycosyltransferase involved in cell wall biosynthesis